MNIRIQIDNLDTTQWTHFIQNHPDANIFHTPEMYEVFQSVKNYSPHILYAKDDNTDLLAIFPFVDIFIKAKYSRLTGRSVSYGGFLCEKSHTGYQALYHILQTRKKIKPNPTVFTEIRNCYDTTAFKAACLRSSYKYEAYLNFIINLDQPLESLLSNIGKHTRKKIRKHLRNPVISFENVTEMKQINECYEILSKTYKFKHVPLADVSLFQAAFQILYPKKMIRAILAKYDGQNIATFIDLMYKDRVYGWYGGFDRSFHNTNVNENIYWNLIEWSVKNGYKWLDLGGAGRPNEKYGVRDFKAKFGGELVNWGRYTYIHHPLLYKLGKLGYQIYHRRIFHD